MRKFGNILWGIVFICLGLIIALNVLGIASINVFFTGWWTLFIIIPCFIGLFHEHDKIGNIIGLVIGILLLMSAQGLIEFRMLVKLIVPIILVLLGLSLIFKDAINRKVTSKIRSLNKEGLDDYTATFSEQKINLDNQEFKGASLNAIFGSVDLNIKDSIISEEQIINASAIFGGIDIIVPANVNVKVKSTSIFGGVSNKTYNKKEENIPTIYVNAFCLFGGVDIK